MHFSLSQRQNLIRCGHRSAIEAFWGDDCQGDREGRPYNIRFHVKQAIGIVRATLAVALAVKKYSWR
ncbi:MAG: hypothetical protein E6I93_07505 [Chloroflexi bacterium]|nr:MAG: hypothetical protein E6I93_07505 [Chloroflexota bacterium]